MKKLIPLLVFALLLLATAAVSADPPPGVGSAFWEYPEGQCGAKPAGSLTWYEGDNIKVLHSNGATNHQTYKCKLEFVSGTPTYVSWEFTLGNCDGHVSLEGKKGMMTMQCFGDWDSTP